MTVASIPTLSKSHVLSGMMLSAVAFALLTSIDTIFKIVAADHPIYQILVINGLIALLPIMAWTKLTGGFHRLHTRHLFRHLGRGSISTLSGFFAIFAYSRLPLSDFYAIVFAGPLLVTALSSFWLGEKVGKRRWMAIAFGFVGVLIVACPIQPDGTHYFQVDDPQIMLGRMSALGSVICYALSVITIRHMRTHETNLTFSFYGYMASISISTCVWFLNMNGPQAAIDLMDILHLILSGLLAGVASLCLMTAYHRTPASLVAPFQYTQIVWGSVAGYLVWSHLPDLHLIIGASIVAASGLFVIYGEMRPKPAA